MSWPAVWERAWDLAGAVPIRIKIMGIVLGLVLMLGLGITWQVRVRLESTLDEELRLRGMSIAGDLAARVVDYLLTNNQFALHELTNETLRNNPDVRYAFILDAGGRVVAHTFERRVPRELLAVHATVLREDSHVESLESEDGPLIDIAAPIFGGRAGVARVGLSEARIGSTVQTITAQLLLATAMVSLIGIAAAYLLTLVLTHPILQLVRVARDIEQGDLARRAQVWSSDEIGRLSQALNAMVGRLETVQRDLVRRNEELRQKDALRGHLLQRVISAQEEERRRIARELHDETSQALTSVMVGLRLLSEEPTVEGSRNRAAELRSTVGAALDAVHHVLFELRPSTLDDNGLAAALQRYTREYARKHSLSVDFQMGNVEGLRLPSQIETTAYRIVQEALTNVARHAQARSVSLLLDRRGESLIAVVEDDGCGFDLASVSTTQAGERNLGLAGMHERAALLGGTLSIESAPGDGTAVFMSLPLAVVEQGTAA